MSEEIKISQLQEANEISANDLMMIIQSGVNKKKNIKQMAKELNPVVVSPTQPTTNEKVWFKKGKNLFNKNNFVSTESYIDGSNGEIKSYTGYTKMLILPINGGNSYTISRTAGKHFRAGTTSSYPANGMTVSNLKVNNTGTSITVTAGANDKYLVCSYYQKGVDTITATVIESSLQIEPGLKASAYEAYIEPTIFVKNEGIFENFGAELLSNQFKLVARNNSTNYNNFKASGFYQCNFQNGTNAPNAYATGMLLVLASYYIVQLLISHINNEMHVYTRMSIDKGSTWLAWKEL
ncbi:MAG: pyocin knob domain-containing protein [Clostridium sp.]|nr:pyocin knob domain-containing protein [Clostridium sp.]